MTSGTAGRRKRMRTTREFTRIPLCDVMRLLAGVLQTCSEIQACDSSPFDEPHGWTVICKCIRYKESGGNNKAYHL